MMSNPPRLASLSVLAVSLFAALEAQATPAQKALTFNMTTISDTLIEIYLMIQHALIPLAAFSLLAIVIGALFGTFNWRWLWMLFGSLFIISSAGAAIGHFWLPPTSTGSSTVSNPQTDLLLNWTNRLHGSPTQPITGDGSAPPPRPAGTDPQTIAEWRQDITAYHLQQFDLAASGLLTLDQQPVYDAARKALISHLATLGPEQRIVQDFSPLRWDRESQIIKASGTYTMQRCADADNKDCVTIFDIPSFTEHSDTTINPAGREDGTPPAVFAEDDPDPGATPDISPDEPQANNPYTIELT